MLSYLDLFNSIWMQNCRSSECSYEVNVLKTWDYQNLNINSKIILNIEGETANREDATRVSCAML